MSNYWTKTDEILRENGGRNPTCPICEQKMFPIDDHGRFGCGCNFLGSSAKARAIPQVPSNVTLTDEQKAEIPPINRLHHSPTKEEQEALQKIMVDMEKLTGLGHVASKAKKDRRC